jgi:solute carrier family 35, member E1
MIPVSERSKYAPLSLGDSGGRPLQQVQTPWVKLGVYYFLLYFFTVVYNVSNKRVLNALPLPASMAVLQLFLGIPLFLPMWIIKPPRHVSLLSKKTLTWVAISHALGNLATIYSLGSGSVSFTHVVKSAEPVFAAVLAGVVLQSYFAPQVYLTLVPIVLGVALASAKEMSFTWFGFTTAMVSNFFYQLRIILSKQIIDSGSEHTKISGANLFRIVTLMAAVFLLPIAVFLEGPKWLPAWRLASSVSPARTNALLVDMLLSGVSYYIYNEIAFWILDIIHPISHAVGNTLKRVILIIASLIVFHVPLSLQGGVGSFVAVLGSFLYALASDRYKNHQQQGGAGGLLAQGPLGCSGSSSGSGNSGSSKKVDDEGFCA